MKFKFTVSVFYSHTFLNDRSERGWDVCVAPLCYTYDQRSNGRHRFER